jgi:trigger factor
MLAVSGCGGGAVQSAFWGCRRERGVMTQIHVEDLSDVKKKVTFEIPEDTVRDVIEAQYRDLKKAVQIKGFRKGKVPLDILRSYFKEKVEADTARKIIEDTFQPGLTEKDLVLVSVVKMDQEGFEPGKPFKYWAEIEVPPKIEVKDYKGLNLKKYRREEREEQVDERLEALRERNARLVPVAESRGVKEGDHLVVDINAESDGQTIPALTVVDYHLEMGRNFYLPDFDAKLEGMKAEESRTITLDLPEDFPRKQIAGKTVTFTVTLKEAKERMLPELDDEFAKDLGQFDTLEALKEEIRQDLRHMAESQTKREMENQMVDLLLERNEFDVPEAMVESRIDDILNQSLQRLAAAGVDARRMPPPSEAQREQIRPSAARIVKAGLLLKGISDQEQLEISDEEFQQGIEERARQLGVTADYLRDEFEKANMGDDFRGTLLQEKVYKFIEDNATITEEEPPAEENGTDL